MKNSYRLLSVGGDRNVNSSGIISNHIVPHCHQFPLYITRIVDYSVHHGTFVVNLKEKAIASQEAMSCLYLTYSYCFIEAFLFRLQNLLDFFVYKQNISGQWPIIGN